jgi:hypothetical protein
MRVGTWSGSDQTSIAETWPVHSARLGYTLFGTGWALPV